jgi:hypothetical protein
VHGAPMTEDELKASLKPCPFCGAGETDVRETRHWGPINRPSEIISVSIHHWCGKQAGVLRSHIEFRGRDHESAQKAWNART